MLIRTAHVAVLLLASAGWILLPRETQAACSYGSSIKGGFSASIQGQFVQSGTLALAGVLKGDGKCGLSGNLLGEINGVPTNVAVTGSYSLSAPTNGTITLEIGNSGATYDIYIAPASKEIVGIESDGTAFADFDLKKQRPDTFSVATLNGSYPFLCTGPENQVIQTGVETYDGAGNYTLASNIFYDSNGGTHEASGTGTYTVSPTGVVTVQFTNTQTGDVWVEGGGIAGKGLGFSIASVSVNGTGGVAGLCGDHKQ